MKNYFIALLFAGALAASAQTAGQRAGRMEPADLLREFDANGDARISRDEAPERMKGRWEQIDTDSDGFVTLEELKARDARVAGGGMQRPEGTGDNVAQRGPMQGGPGGTRGSRTDFKPAAGFSVITVGTGSPQYDKDRSGPCAVVQLDGRCYLVDMGNGTQARLSEAGIGWRQFDALLFTHHHLDHDEEFVPVFIHTQLMGGRPTIAGPPGTSNYVEFIRRFYAEDMAYRLQRQNRTAADLGKPVVRDLTGGEKFMLGRAKVTTAKVNHTIYTIAYRFDVDGKSIVISGDLSYSDSLVELARGADVLVIDSGASPVRTGQGERAGGGTGRPMGAGDATHAHSSRQEVCEMAQKAGVKKLVLTHIAPGEVDEEATKKAIGEIFKGEVIVGHDLLEVTPDAIGAQATTEVRTSNHSTGHARIFVNAKSTGRHDGASWSTAFATVQDGIDAADKQGGGEVWVAAGTYKPTAGEGRAATVTMRPGVAIYGGFAGTETKLEDRNWERNVTTLSGDLGHEGDKSDNACHVVTGADDAVLDGFVITGGHGFDAGPPGLGASGGQRPQGPPSGASGQHQIHISPSLVLSGANSGSGAGMVNYQASPLVRNCTFKDNDAGKGGAMYNMTAKSFPPRPDFVASAPTVVNCRFIDNSARGRGGAVANDLGTSPTFSNCVFTGNSCEGKGGAMYNDFGCSPTIVGCLFARNSSVSAGAIGNDGGSSPLIEHCTFTQNRAKEEGAALYQGTGPANNPTVLGCILWGNLCDNGPAEIFAWHDNDPKVTGSCVQGGYAGEGNFDKDPRLDADFKPAADSPCKAIGHTAPVTGELPKRAARALAAAPVPPAPFTPGPASIVCVNAANTQGPWDGALFRTGYRTLQEALAATAGHSAEIWVMAGTYRTSDGADRSSSFELHRGVAVYGGFRGTETRRDQRDVAANATILSGDIGRANDASDNAYHVVIGADASVLDGFTIRDGNADGTTYDAKGGGMINYLRSPQSGPMGLPSGLSPIVRNCVFTHNRASEGGAVYDYDRGAPQFLNCRFSGNEAGYGGALVDRVGVRSTISNCVFESNTATWRAGAVYLDYGARPRIVACRFENNRSECHGGALATISRASQLEATIPLLTDCAFTGNTAKNRGGAIANSDSAVVGLRNCTFSGNRAASGSILANDYRSQAVLIDCRGAEDAGIASDAQSSVTRSQADWPDQGVPATAQGFAPRMRAGAGP